MKKIRVFCITLGLFSLGIKQGLSIGPIPDDMRILPPEIQKKKEELPLIGRMPYDAGRYNTSEYMIGKVAVGVIFPESNLNEAAGGEDWTDEEINRVKQEIEAGFLWWSKIEENAGLCFVYEYKTKISTSYEPIKKSSDEQGSWIKEVMNNLGYPGQDDPYYYFEQVYNYVNDLRNRHNTDWALVAFVVDSSGDEDGKFKDGRFAYAYLGGPFMVMTYDNNGYGINNMDAVAAHELGHIFYALDEYEGSRCRAEDRSGYLDVENGNHEVDGRINVHCIMRGGIYPFITKEVCHYTRGQVGLWDSDEDNLLNIVDTGGITIKQTASRRFEGKATVLPPLINKNPKIVYEDRRRNITVAKIGGVEWRVRGEVGWSSAIPKDGNYNSVEEVFYFICDKDIPERDLDLRIRYLIGDKEIVSKETEIKIEEGLTAGNVKIKYKDNKGRDHGYFTPNPNDGEKLIIIYSPKKKDSIVHMEIYSYLGQLIYSERKNSEDGEVKFEWNGRNMNKDICSSGIYILKIKEEGRHSIVKKICIMR